MLIVNKSSSVNYVNAPAYGGIALAQNLVFGLRPTNPANTINLADGPDKSIITSNTAEYSSKGIIGSASRYIDTDFAPKSDSIMIKAVMQFVRMRTDQGLIVSVLGGLDRGTTRGTGIWMTTIANGSNFDYELRLESTALNGARLVRRVGQKFMINQKVTDSQLLNVWCQVNDATGEIRIKINDNDWASFRVSADDYSQRNEMPWRIGLLPTMSSNDNAGVEISEVLVWDKILTSAEIDQQNKLSQRWLSTLAQLATQ